MRDPSLLSNLLAWSLQVAGLVVAGCALPWLLRLHAPGVRHLYWRLLLLVALLLPALQAWQPIAPVPADVLSMPESSGLIPSGGDPSSTPLPAVAPARVPGWPALLGAVLAAGAALRFAWLTAGLFRLRRLRRRSDPSTRDEPAALGLEGTPYVDVRFVAAVRQPITFGIRHPVVLLPSSLRRRPVAIRRAVMEHELWHVRRRDWLWVVVEEAVRCVLWFHPAIHWLISRIQLSREEVVDELTVLSTNGRREYLEALLAFADEPSLYPASPFARRCHLFHRMLLISREAVMSSRRIVATCAVMGAIVSAGGWYSVSAFPLTTAAPSARRFASAPALPAAVKSGSAAAPSPAVDAPAQSQPRDLRPGEPRPASQREVDLRASLASQPTLNGFLELSRLQEARGAVGEAEATLNQAHVTLSGNPAVLLAAAGFYNRTGQFEKTIDAMEEAAGLAPTAAASHQIATFYEEKVRRDTSLSQDDRLRYVQAGVAAEDRALAINPDYVDAMIVKNILLRHQANAETNPLTRTQLIAEADVLRTRAMELQKTRTLIAGGRQLSTTIRMTPPPPPPPPPSQYPRVELSAGELVDGISPVRVGGNIKPPFKIRDVRPVYPPVALEAKVSGVVIIEATVDTTGAVQQTKVLRSIPLLDEAAIEAVRQWTFTPTELNGTLVPVIMTVTVNFTMQ